VKKRVFITGFVSWKQKHIRLPKDMEERKEEPMKKFKKQQKAKGTLWSEPIIKGTDPF
jgi:hypothetical protein